MIILIDQDNVLSDFEKQFLVKWREQYPELPYIPFEKRNTFKIYDQYSPKYKSLIRSIYRAKGFYRSLPLVEGGIEALVEMSELGNNVFICTSPLSLYENCVLEKYEWVEEHLGPEWIKKIILTKDKTLVKGDILIDDKPEITGVQTPIWEHIIYDRPYNKYINSKRRLNWKNWKEVLLS